MVAAADEEKKPVVVVVSSPSSLSSLLLLLSSSSCSSSSSMLLKMTKVVMVVVLLMSMVGVGVRGERILGEQNEDFDFDGLPGVQHEFKVEIHAGAQDCFFQKVAKGASVHVSFEVLRGGDHLVTVAVRNSYGQVVRAEHTKNNGVLQFEAPNEDTHAICIDNTHSSFSGKLVYLYLVAFVMDDWSAYAKEVDNIVSFTENATLALSNVELSVQAMRNSQIKVRQHSMRDMYLAWSNHSYVQRWSILQCLVIVLTSGVQVLFVRRLFRTTNVTPHTAKPRA